MRLVLGLLMGCACVGAVMAQTATTVTYKCERGARVDATYLTVTEGAFAVVTAEGRQVALQADSSGGEGRFSSVEDGAPYVWWVRNGEAELSVKMGGSDIAVLRKCHEG